MAYVKKNWQNTPSTNTPINADNLNHMEQGIYDAAAVADQAEAGVEALDPRMDLVEQRLDNLIPQGTPTEGNAELIDIRVGANGVTYPDAGSAVRGQYGDLKSALSDVEDVIYSENVESAQSISYTTTTNVNNSYYPFPFVQGKKYRVQVSFTETGVPYPTSEGFAETLYTTTAESTSASYKKDTIKQQSDFSAVDVVFTASENASYVRLYTRSMYGSIVFSGAVTISVIENNISEISKEIDYMEKFNTINQFTAKDDVEKQNSYANVIALYDALVLAHPNYVTKTALNDVSLGAVIYEYTFSTGKYNAVPGRRTSYASYAKPKVLITTGVHGDEKGSISSAYTVMKALCEDQRMRKLKEQVEFHVVPVVNIYGMDNDDRYDANDVNINRNFDARWSISAENAGSAPASEYATQVIQDWLDDNSDALFYLDYHNSGYHDELTYFGVDIEESDDNVNALCSHYWNGLTRIFAYWDDVRDLDRTSLIYGYVGRVPFTGTAVAYGCEKAGIPSALLETQVRMPSDGSADTYNKTVIGIAAESLANILLGMYDYLNANINVV